MAGGRQASRLRLRSSRRTVADVDCHGPAGCDFCELYTVDRAHLDNFTTQPGSRQRLRGLPRVRVTGRGGRHAAAAEGGGPARVDRQDQPLERGHHQEVGRVASELHGLARSCQAPRELRTVGAWGAIGGEDGSVAVRLPRWSRGGRVTGFLNVRSPR